ncbi:MAG: DUF1684 domain-containing protein [Thermoleophilia bacterium]|nr:DUF1684 domain-containing protein [Thermoleophilia bacterium]
MAWRMERDEVFRSHPQSPVPEGRRAGFGGMGFFPYDPTWRLEAVVEPAAADAGKTPSAPDARFRQVGMAVAERDGMPIRLPLLWLDSYGGGLFLPFRDATNGRETYGGGRYLLDQAKGADLGVTTTGRLILDFNYAYHPSCAHDPRWTCPLASPGSVIDMLVRAGELAP